MKRNGNRPVLITDAEHSRDDQLRHREVRYVLMMSLRALCLVAAAVLVVVGAPMLWLWVPLCVAGMVLLPWLAVILANDRPPKQRYRLGHRAAHRQRQIEPTVLSAPPRTIDAEHEVVGQTGTWRVDAGHPEDERAGTARPGDGRAGTGRPGDGEADTAPADTERGTTRRT